MLNPLCPDLFNLLRQHPLGLSEHAILTSLSDHVLFRGQDRHQPLTLFRQHFLVMNGLYQLQQQLETEQEFFLSISPLLIRLLTRKVTDNRAISMEDGNQLRDYYLDWRHYQTTTGGDVCDLLTAFWQRINGQDERNGALVTLDLGKMASADQITRRYRELATRHHPDKGGNPDKFIQIRQAYELLMSTH